MSINDQPHPTHPRCSLQDQTGPAVVSEALKGHKTLAQLSSEFGIHAQMITTGLASQWKRQLLDGLPALFETSTSKPTLSAEQREQIEAPPSYYYQSLGESTQNLALMERIDRLFTERPEMGIRRMHQDISTADNPINIKRVHRLMRLMGLEAVYRKPNLSKPAEGYQIYPYLLRGVVIDEPNHVWSTDITYIPMVNGFWYLCVVIEWYTRFILGWRLSNTLLADFCIDALADAFKQWGQPRIFNTARLDRRSIKPATRTRDRPQKFRLSKPG